MDERRVKRCVGGDEMRDGSRLNGLEMGMAHVQGRAA
jgi:hypothetical protein